MKKLFILIIFLSYGCKENNDGGQSMNSGVVQEFNNKVKMEELYRKALIEGDTLAFWELKRIFVISEHSQEFIYVSTVMGERHNYAPAFRLNYKLLRNENSTIKTIAIYNLLKSYELGNRKDMNDLKKIFPKGIPTSVNYWKKQNISD